jgi:glycosyltransferase involved in cell wall biosynthesis
MNDAGARAEVVKLPTWSFSEAIRIIKRYSAPGTVFHIQYPSLGMGASPAAALFPLIAHGHATFFTLHEFTLFNPVRKAYFLPFALTSDHVIFTNEPEQCHYARFFPFARDDGIVLPIGSNFDSSGDSPTQGRRLVYFGQIAPGKGIEEFLDAVRTLRARRCNIPCAILGAEVSPDSALSRRMAAEAQTLDITRLPNLSRDEVSAELAKSSIAFLPFPDGVCDKRGSALACLASGLGVVTRHGAQTPQWWRDATHGSRDSIDAARLIEDIDRGDVPREPNLDTRMRGLSARRWSEIAQAHLALYARARSCVTLPLERRIR